jgi:hypothetical protein
MLALRSDQTGTPASATTTKLAPATLADVCQTMAAWLKTPGPASTAGQPIASLIT